MSSSSSNPQSTARRVAAALKYIYRFGAFSGIKLFMQTLTSGTKKGGGKNIHLTPSGFSIPIQARPGTSDLPTFEKVFIDQEYNFDLPNFPTNLIIDAGANVGYASLFFANRFPQAQIIAIEPESENFAMLQLNTQGFPRIKPVQAALWNKPISLSIANPEAESWEFQVRETAPADSNGSDIKARQIPGITIPELIKMSGQQRISVLKLDIEGAEKELFESGSEDWLGLVDMIIIELHDRYRPGCSSTFYRALSPYEFGQFPLGENIFVVLNPNPQSENS